MKVLIIVSCLVALAAAKFNICQNQANGHFYKDFSDCKRYLACVNGVSLSGSCPDQLLFNSKTSTCDYSSNVQCSSCPSTGMKTFALEGSCRQYVRCIAGRAEYLECPSDLFYDKNTQSCNLQSEVDCVESICSGSGSYSVQSNEDCSVYYNCNRGQPTRMQCAGTNYYNPQTQLCDKRENVVCKIQPARVAELTDVTVSCPPTGQHFYPHPSDCNHYYLCVNGVSAILSCGPVLVYDIMTQSCNMPERSTCITKFN